MLKIVICDDDQHQTQLVRLMVEETLQEHRLNNKAKVVLVTNSAQAVCSFAEKENELCLYFLDIKMNNDTEALKPRR